VSKAGPALGATFRFTSRWKEELVVAGPGGSFILELPMGRLSAYLPTREAWKDQAPEWAADLWPVLKAELEAWCDASRADLVIDPTATVTPLHEASPEARGSGRGGSDDKL
jgi:hypothetical protein